jgi:murein DD-endopeptidase MepM/ murein hydrolase activator NlpD
VPVFSRARLRILDRPHAAVLAAVVALAVTSTSRSGNTVYADQATATATSTASPTASPTPTLTPRPTATPAKPTATVPVREEATPARERHRHRVKQHTTPGPQATPTLATTGEPKSQRPHKHKKHHAKAKPTPTATPLINLNTEDSISPVTCNGPGKPVAGKPFLIPPYHGWTSMVTYFDHDSPNFLKDGLTITANGDQARLDAVHVRTDFPAYWNPDLRLYLDYDGHNGYDYDLLYQSVYAAARGKVVFAGMEYPTMPDHGYGKMIMVSHSGGYVTLYGHLSKLLVKKGQRLKQGQRIGISGNTGHSTGPHLHFTVFHNCTPTDPYGWTGGGPDPLVSYANESSVYLWKRAPEIVNPLPSWPGIADLPSGAVKRIILLKLPSTRGGASAFTRELRTMATHVQQQIGGTAVAKIDMQRGAVDTTADLSADQIYQLKGVVSIVGPDVVDGAHSDLLAALAKDALVTRHRELKLTRSGDWRGYLMTWQGRTMLVGKGKRGATVTMRIRAGRGGGVTRRVIADPSSGAYVLDLGKLSSGEKRTVQKELQQASGKSSAVKTVKSAEPAPVLAPDRHSSTSGDDRSGWLAVIALLALAAGLYVSRHRFNFWNTGSS